MAQIRNEPGSTEGQFLTVGNEPQNIEDTQATQASSPSSNRRLALPKDRNAGTLLRATLAAGESSESAADTTADSPTQPPAALSTNAQLAQLGVSLPAYFHVAVPMDGSTSVETFIETRSPVYQQLHAMLKDFAAIGNRKEALSRAQKGQMSTIKQESESLINTANRVVSESLSTFSDVLSSGQLTSLAAARPSWERNIKNGQEKILPLWNQLKELPRNREFKDSARHLMRACISQLYALQYMYKKTEMGRFHDQFSVALSNYEKAAISRNFAATKAEAEKLNNIVQRQFAPAMQEYWALFKSYKDHIDAMALPLEKTLPAVYLKPFKDFLPYSHLGAIASLYHLLALPIHASGKVNYDSRAALAKEERRQLLATSESSSLSLTRIESHSAGTKLVHDLNAITKFLLEHLNALVLLLDLPAQEVRGTNSKNPSREEIQTLANNFRRASEALAQEQNFVRNQIDEDELTGQEPDGIEALIHVLKNRADACAAMAAELDSYTQYCPSRPPSAEQKMEAHEKWLNEYMQQLSLQESSMGRVVQASAGKSVTIKTKQTQQATRREATSPKLLSSGKILKLYGDAQRLIQNADAKAFSWEDGGISFVRKEDLKDASNGHTKARRILETLRTAAESSDNLEEIEEAVAVLSMSTGELRRYLVSEIERCLNESRLNLALSQSVKSEIPTQKIITDLLALNMQDPDKGAIRSWPTSDRGAVRPDTWRDRETGTRHPSVLLVVQYDYTPVIVESASGGPHPYTVLPPALHLHLKPGFIVKTPDDLLKLGKEHIQVALLKPGSVSDTGRKEVERLRREEKIDIHVPHVRVDTLEWAVGEVHAMAGTPMPEGARLLHPDLQPEEDTELYSEN